MKIKIGKTDDGQSVTIDVEKLIDTRMLVQGASGCGKSWLLRLLCEQMAKKVQLIVIDREGEFATLRERIDMLLVGEGREVATDIRSAKLLCKRVMELGINCHIDLYELKPAKRPEYVDKFLDTLVNLPRKYWRPLLLVIDEAHQFAPESNGRGKESRESVINATSLGRKRSFAPILATQRIAKLHKDAAADLLNVVVGTTSLDVDVKRAMTDLGFEAKRRQELKLLKPGEFFAYGPAFNIPGVFKFRASAVTTTHPKPGHRHKIEPPKPSAKIKRALGEFADLPEQAEAEAKTFEDAKKQIAKLQRELKAKPRPAPNDATISAAVDSALKKRDREWQRQLQEKEKANAHLVTALNRIQTMAAKASGIELSPTTVPPRVPPKPAARTATRNQRPTR